MVRKIAGKYRIKTATATIDVRGADFAVVVAPPPNNMAQKEREWNKKHIPGGLLTAVLTGGDQAVVDVSGRFGSVVRVNALSLTAVGAGEPAMQATYIGSTSLEVLEKIAPQATESSTQSEKTTQSSAPCWTFSSQPSELKYFRICNPK